ncbi:DUF4123 domain-containing protein [Marinobacter sp. F3R11]|uniref:DUF4123 domain-containing protein n=1 Tax=Marinobacter sp. F3R11 TaxID=2267231 RepID=UPI0016514262|nr:DUF4123 domain-containing protein [Marinobacter sp. F3R11]
MKDFPAVSPEAQTPIVFHHHSNSPGEDTCGYLIDQAKHPDTLRRLFEHDPIPVYDLPYIHSEYREQACDGPVIIQPTTAWSEKWLQDWVTEGKALAVHGKTLALEEIRDHFVSLNTVSTPNGDSLFRYADPAALGSLAESLSPHQRERILGPLTAIRGHYAGTSWTLTREQPSVPQDKLQKQRNLPLELTQENLLSVEAYRRNLLAEALANNNGLDAHTVFSWFRQLEALGAPSEQGLVEGSELLISRGFTQALSDEELTTIRTARQGDCWSDTLDAIATLSDSQEGT